MKAVFFLCAAALVVVLASCGNFPPPTQEDLDNKRQFLKERGRNVDCTGNHTFYQYEDCDARCDFKPSDNCAGGAAFISCRACKEGYIPVDHTREQCVKPEDCPK
ncbi:unnamed protein product [Larinioides sclopetarius]|uniref:Uncharacterized protein n=1 Tax=Larinioides sclopetarius TaxID=280406 RepID=A0AAV2AI07_9ARAC